MARKHAQFALDLSGIAKGFAVDEMMRMIETFGISNALVSLDGELKAQGGRQGRWDIMARSGGSA